MPLQSGRVPLWVATAPHLNVAEQSFLERVAKAGMTAAQALAAVRKRRQKQGLTGPGKTAVHDFLHGKNSSTRPTRDKRCQDQSVYTRVACV